ncbi:hypothetical protein KAR91_82530 [Candidatus Pacearchaeota archaeon]|nr:hypothetical protein [Candidatus Pacearchaeota archaeon]
MKFKILIESSKKFVTDNNGNEVIKDCRDDAQKIVDKLINDGALESDLTIAFGDVF